MQFGTNTRKYCSYQSFICQLNYTDKMATPFAHSTENCLNKKKKSLAQGRSQNKIIRENCVINWRHLVRQNGSGLLFKIGAEKGLFKIFFTFFYIFSITENFHKLGHIFRKIFANYQQSFKILRPLFRHFSIFFHQWKLNIFLTAEADAKRFSFSQNQIFFKRKLDCPRHLKSSKFAFLEIEAFKVSKTSKHIGEKLNVALS